MKSKVTKLSVLLVFVVLSGIIPQPNLCAQPDTALYRIVGRQYMDAGEYSKALKAYTSLIKIDPISAKAYNFRGNAYTYLKKYDEAINDYTKAIALDSMFEKAYFNLANVFGKLKKYSEALYDLSIVIKMDSTYADAYRIRGITYIYLEKYNLGLKDLKTAILFNPKDYLNWTFLGNVMLDMKDLKKSAECFDTALKLQPTDTVAINNLLYCAQMSYHNKDYGEAVICYKSLINYQPFNKELSVDLAGVFEDNNQIDSAKIILENVLKYDPKCFSALAKIGEIYGKHLNDINKSLKYLLSAYAIKDNDVSLLENIGVAYGIQKEFELSIKFLKKALALDPLNSSINSNLANTYELSGDSKNADKYFAIAKKISNHK